MNTQEVELVLKRIDTLLQSTRGDRIREIEKRDKTYLYVTTGILTISVTFLSNANLNNLEGESILVYSWCALLISIIAHLLGSHTVDKHFAVKESELWSVKSQFENQYTGKIIIDTE
ncbi:MAG: hypothetical protein RLZZ234_879, partial [Candidatus Parcubacteria bacterium]